MVYSQESTEEVDRTNPIRNGIRAVTSLVRRAHVRSMNVAQPSAAKDMLHRYFGELEPLELRISISVSISCGATRSRTSSSHASLDLSRASEVMKFLVGIILVQARGVFYEKRTDKKSNAIVSRVAAQTSSMYTSLNEEPRSLWAEVS
ncbi:hypothetical protein BD413DRAFT_312984 [Trametes elegans]|nr:hypothetical protein BD413DRAFT_312984 [Trametes elegans]